MAVLFIILGMIIALLLLAVRQPCMFRLERAAVIAAPPEKIFPLIDDLREWKHWSPWERKDPAQKIDFSSMAQGRGASMAWEGNRQVGRGSMEIAESVPSSFVKIRLRFLAPFKASHETEFRLVPYNGGTLVSWVMYGKAPFVAKLMGLVMNCDGMVGRDFEDGLAAMKVAAEKASL